MKKNCRGFSLFYKECLTYKEIPLKIKMKYILRFLQCKLYDEEGCVELEFPLAFTRQKINRPISKITTKIIGIIKDFFL